MEGGAKREERRSQTDRPCEWLLGSETVFKLHVNDATQPGQHVPSSGVLCTYFLRRANLQVLAGTSVRLPRRSFKSRRHRGRLQVVWRTVLCYQLMSLRQEGHLHAPSKPPGD